MRAPAGAPCTLRVGGAQGQLRADFVKIHGDLSSTHSDAGSFPGPSVPSYAASSSAHVARPAPLLTDDDAPPNEGPAPPDAIPGPPLN